MNNQATVLGQLGEADAAIAMLPHLLQVPAGVPPGDLGYSPFGDLSRKNARFEELVRNPAPVRY